MENSIEKTNRQELIYDFFSSPIGKLLLVARGDGLCRIGINEEPEQLPSAYRQGLIRKSSPFIPIKEELARYFARELTRFQVPVVFLDGSEFQRRVWQQLTRIPYGRVTTYQWLAQQLGMPHGARAVGQANRANPIPIIIPCHRVISSNGRLGGYRQGVEIKRKLLNLEGFLL